jgi:hypothetical protein
MDKSQVVPNHLTLQERMGFKASRRSSRSQTTTGDVRNWRGLITRLFFRLA